MSPNATHRCLGLAFVAMLAAVPLAQVLVESKRGKSPALLDLFTEAPTARNLRAFDRRLEDSSVTVRTLRSWMQAAQFLVLHEGGAKALVGRDGNLFYAPGVNTLTQSPQHGDSSVQNALAAVTSFRDALDERGIRLIVLPVPNKESVYPQWFSFAAKHPQRIINPETRAFFAGCEAAGVEVVDLFARYREISRYPYYLAQDTHWSPLGLAVAAHAVAERIGRHGDTHFESRPIVFQIHGDLVRMLRSPVLESNLQPEEITAAQITNPTDAPNSEILVLGDSFSRIFQTDEPQNAGFIAHLARELFTPVASINNDGGGSTLIRQELARHPQLLAGKKIVVWEFTERDLRLGTEGWQIVPLPKLTSYRSPAGAGG